MPTYKGVEVWIEDSEYRKLNHQEVTINLVDDRTVTMKTEMLRDELYSVHCLSPISVFCDVFVVTASRTRKRAARFHLDKSLAISENASGSSTDHTEGQFRDHGLRTPKRVFQPGKLGSVEVEIRRIGEIIKEEPREENEADGIEGVATEFCMIDDFDQPPWLVFDFNISVKVSLAAPASTAEHIRRRVVHRTLKNQALATSGSRPRNSSTEGSGNQTSCEACYECLPNSKKRPREHDGCDGSASVGRNPIDANSDPLQQEYQKEVAEERRLLRELQERLQTKKTRNMELRRLLEETP